MHKGKLTRKDIKIKYLVIVLTITALLVGCNTNGNKTIKRKVYSKRVELIKKLHNRIIFVLQKDSYPNYSLFYIKPSNNKSQLVLKTNNEITTDYLSDREKMAIRFTKSGNTRTGDIYFADIDGSNQRRIVRGGGFSFFKDRKRFVFSSDLSEGVQTYFIYIADLNGKNIRRLTFKPKGINRKNGFRYMYVGDNLPEISSNGNFIIFSSNWYRQGEGDDLFRINSDGSNRKQLTNGKVKGIDYNYQAISNDDKIAVLARDKKDKSSLVIMDINGKILKAFPLAGRNPNVYPSFVWSPDNKSIAIQDYGSISILNLKNGKIKKVFQLSDKDSQTIQSVNWLK